MRAARLTLSTLLALALLAQSACVAPRGGVFPQGDGRLVFPPAPDVPRIAWVGELRGEESLGIRTGGLDVLRDIVAGPAPQAVFVNPNAVAVEGERLLVSDGELGAVHILDLGTPRRYRAVAEADAAPLGGPIDVAFLDGGRFAVADSRRAAVFVFRPDGAFERTLGAGALRRPAGVAWNAAARELWVLDAGAHQVVVFDAAGGEVRRIGTRGGGPLEFNFPAGISYSATHGAALADAMNFRVQLLAPGAAAPIVFGRKGDAAGDFALPRDVAFDSAGHVYVLDSHFENVQIFDSAGRLLMMFGGPGAGAGELSLPSGITIDSRDRVWIADTYNRRVQVFQYLAEAPS